MANASTRQLTESVIGEVCNESRWSDLRIEQALMELQASHECFMQGPDCTYRQLNADGTRIIYHGVKKHFACPFHADTYATIEGPEAKVVRLIHVREALNVEKIRRDEVKRKRLELEKEFEKKFRDFIRRHIAARDGVEIDLVEDSHVDARIARMSPQQVATIKDVLAPAKDETRPRYVSASPRLVIANG